MPDNILIDNYHIGKAHIHPDPRKHECRIELNEQDSEEIFETIKDYLDICKSFDVDELIEVLK